MGLGALPLVNHHPVLVSLVYARIFELGSIFGGTNGGFFLIMVFQGTYFSLAFACCLLWFKRMGLPGTALKACFLFWGLLPAFPLFVEFLVKDAPATATATLFMMQIVVRLWSDRRGVPVRFSSWPVLFLTAVLCCLTRNESMFVTIPTILCLMILPEGRQKVLAVSVASGVLAFMLFWNGLLLPSLGIKTSNIREAMSLPLQQTARYIKEHPNDITEDERSSLQEVCSVDISTLGNYYKEDISDPVKAQFFAKTSSITKYLSSWATMGARHPGTYLTAFLAGSRGYWYPFSNKDIYEYIQLPSYGSHALLEHNWTANSQWVEDAWGNSFDDQGHVVFPAAAAQLQNALKTAAGLPVLGLLFVPATYIWIALVLCAYLASRKSIGAVFVVPVLIHILIFMDTPLDGAMRYALPFVAMVPLLFGSIFVLPRVKETRANQK
jgi:hypothetical protein